MLRAKTGSVVCPNCGRLVGVRDAECFNCKRRNPGLWGWAPLLSKMGRDLGFTEIATGGCVALYVLSLLLTGEGVLGGGIFSFLSPSGESIFLLGASGAVPVFQYHRWWTPLSAAWLHGGLLHIVMNLLWIRSLAPEVAALFGVGRLVLIYTASSVAGFLATSVMAFFPIPFLGGASLTVGASAPLFGLMGALVLYGRRTGQSRRSQIYLQYAVIWIVIGFLGGSGLRIDNWAHLGGFAGGYLTARWLDPLRDETADHWIAALVCLAATALAIGASVVTALPIVQR